MIIDPADNADYLVSKCREFGVEPKAVLLTHAHFDHMLAADDIRKNSVASFMFTWMMSGC